MSSRLDHRGNIVLGLMVAAAAAGLALLASSVIGTRAAVGQKRIRDARMPLAIRYGAESATQAYRLAEQTYDRAVAAVAACNGISRPFIEAMAKGSGCGSGNIQVFSSADWSTPDIYTYAGAGCRIRPNNGGSDCGNAARLQVITIGDDQSARSRVGYGKLEIYLLRAVPDKDVLEMALRIRQPHALLETEDETYHAFAIRSGFGNSAHLEPDGRVTQQRVDPIALCPGVEWGAFRYFNDGTSSCEDFAQLGSGTGLAYYASRFGGRYLGFRPSDGMIVDLLSLKSGGAASGYVIDESGFVGSGTDRREIFVPYNRAALVNADDLTVIRRSIYVVHGSGIDTRISLLADQGSGNWTLLPVCRLGQLGWSQSYSGIAGPNWSDAIDPRAAYAYEQATFYLKTDGGDLIRAQVRGPASAVSAPGIVDPVVDCTVSKPSNLAQRIEFKRTLGFDRIANERPYIIY